MHALIIEDDYLIGHTIEDHLRELGFSSFSFARSEDAAVAAARERHPDLITADLRLVPGSGVHAVQTICTNRRCAVIFVTGFAPDIEDEVQNAIVVQKPIKDREFKDAVKVALARSAARRD